MWLSGCTGQDSAGFISAERGWKDRCKGGTKPLMSSDFTAVEMKITRWRRRREGREEDFHRIKEDSSVIKE